MTKKSNVVELVSVFNKRAPGGQVPLTKCEQKFDKLRARPPVLNCKRKMNKK